MWDPDGSYLTYLPLPKVPFDKAFCFGPRGFPKFRRSQVAALQQEAKDTLQHFDPQNESSLADLRVSAYSVHFHETGCYWRDLDTATAHSSFRPWTV